MKTVEAEIQVGADGTAVIQSKFPQDVPAGDYRAVVRLEEKVEPPISAAGVRTPPALPVHDLGPWPDSLSLRREDFYGDDGR